MHSCDQHVLIRISGSRSLLDTFYYPKKACAPGNELNRVALRNHLALLEITSFCKNRSGRIQGWISTYQH